MKDNNYKKLNIEVKYGDELSCFIGLIYGQSGSLVVPSEGNLRVQSGYMRESLSPKRGVVSNSSRLLPTKNLSGADNPQGSRSLMGVDPSETVRHHPLSFIEKGDDTVRAARRRAEAGRNDLPPLL
jgi:hypothetical protein